MEGADGLPGVGHKPSLYYEGINDKWGGGGGLSMYYAYTATVYPRMRFYIVA